jgi:hypothetical protein
MNSKTFIRVRKCGGPSTAFLLFGPALLLSSIGVLLLAAAVRN